MDHPIFSLSFSASPLPSFASYASQADGHHGSALAGGDVKMNIGRSASFHGGEHSSSSLGPNNHSNNSNNSCGATGLDGPKPSREYLGAEFSSTHQLRDGGGGGSSGVGGGGPGFLTDPTLGGPLGTLPGFSLVIILFRWPRYTPSLMTFSLLLWVSHPQKL